jgi:hypothetical protein
MELRRMTSKAELKGMLVPILATIEQKAFLG